jgi:meiotic recombination protein SPO11
MVRWILVVEKEATFKCLLNSPFWNSVATQGIVVTVSCARLSGTIGANAKLQAKGYPDLSTRSFLRCIATHNQGSRPPVYFLVDFDPDGFSILATYAFGSRSLAHETAGLALPAEQLALFGITSSLIADLVSTDRNHDAVGINHACSVDDKILPLSPRDRRKAIAMLNDSAFAVQSGESTAKDLRGKCRREIQIMLVLGIKAELQILSETWEGFASWTERKLNEEMLTPKTC